MITQTVSRLRGAFQNISIVQKNIWIRIILLLVSLILISVLFSVYLPRGDDWETFRGASNRILQNASLYNEKITFAYFSNPPWVAVLLLPAALLPFRIGQAVVALASCVMVAALAHKYKIGILGLVLVLLSPPMVYVLLHGQIDALVLGGVLLPSEWWIVVGVSKPQVTIGLIFGLKRTQWKRTLLITCGIFLVTFILWGNWPMSLITRPAPFISSGHNVWLGLWPFQVPVGVALVLLGIKHKDERYLLAASPFLSPYAAMSSFLGVWFIATAVLDKWQATIVFLSWWGAVAYRYFV